MQGYLDESLTLVKCQRVTDGYVVPISSPVVDVNCPPKVTYKTIFDVELDYRRYRGVIDDDEVLPANVPADVVDDFGGTFSQEALWKPDDGASLTAVDGSVSAMALARLSMTVSISGSEYADHVMV